MERNTQTIGEEVANSVLHGIGGLLGIAGLVVLVRNARSSVPVYVIFAGAMILMFLASALYHGLCPQSIKRDRQADPRAPAASSWTSIIEVFRTFDHQAIYIFIAGTYTPFCLLALKGSLGWALFAFEWVLALTGIVLSALRNRFLKKVEMVIFILMGWAILAGCIPLARFLPLQSFILLFAGGILYTAGTFFYRAGKGKSAGQNSGSGEAPRGKIKKRTYGAHVIWHLFVMAGAACHWLSVWFLCLTA